MVESGRENVQSHGRDFKSYPKRINKDIIVSLLDQGSIPCTSTYFKTKTKVI